MPTDILIPAAIENQITQKNAYQIKAKVILELANGAIDPSVDKILSAKNVLVVPDVLANGGGVVVSYFEWLQNRQSEVWSESQVLNRLKEAMIKSFDDVWEISQNYKVDLRAAAYVLAVGRIVKAMKKHG